MDESAPSTTTPDSAIADAHPPPATLRPTSGEFIMSGSLTPLPDGDRVPKDLPGIPPGPMPGLQHRREVQLMVGRWRNSVSLWGRILSGRSRGPWDDLHRFTLPQHTMYIK